MTYTFKKAVRENVALIIGLAGGTGSGKTYSAMRLASGIAGSKRFAVIDTENGRASHYADQFAFDTCDLRAPFRPYTYAEAIKAADAAGYPVIVVDSASHEHAGEGGLLDWHEEELDRMAGTDFGKREACKMGAWVKPKAGHKHMMNILLQVKAHIIICFRAEEKIEMVKENGKMVVRKKESPVGKDGWVPICEKNLPFEATCSFLLLASNPGIPNPIKLQAQHKAFFQVGQPIDEQAGMSLAQWAYGGQAARPKTLAAALMTKPVEPAPTVEQNAHPQQLPVAEAPLEPAAMSDHPAEAPPPVRNGILVWEGCFGSLDEPTSSAAPHKLHCFDSQEERVFDTWGEPTCLKGVNLKLLVGHPVRVDYQIRENTGKNGRVYKNMTLEHLTLVNGEE